LNKTITADSVYKWVRRHVLHRARIQDWSARCHRASSSYQGIRAIIPIRFSGALRTIALLEAAKGALVLLVGFGLLSLVHHDVRQAAEHLIAHAHLNPASRYPHIFIDVANQLTDTRLLLTAAGSSAYSLARFIEAYGLWYAKRWAQWFAAVSGGIYVPFELFELYEHVTLAKPGRLDGEPGSRCLHALQLVPCRGQEEKGGVQQLQKPPHRESTKIL